MKYKLIYLEWVDACGQGEWLEPREGYNFDPMKVTTCGWLVKETSKSITITHTFSDHDHINGYITIPKGWITKRRNVKL